MRRIKKFFDYLIYSIVPHKRHRNIPHLLQARALFFLVVLAAGLFFLSQNNAFLIKKLNLTATVYPAVLADLANKGRQLHGAPELVWNEDLALAAKLKAEDMLNNSYFAHYSPSGVTPWHWLDQVDYQFIYAGENLAVDFTESADVQNAWLNSPKHRENIMNSRFREIGIATVDGFFEGKNTTFVVEFFGTPSLPATQIKNKVKVAQAQTEEEVVVAADEGGDVAGAYTEEATSITKELQVIKETPEFVAVKNLSAVEQPLNGTSTAIKAKSVSAWYERFLVSPLYPVKIILTIIVGLLILAILLVLVKGYQSHHRQPILLGTLSLVFIMSLLLLISIF